MNLKDLKDVVKEGEEITPLIEYMWDVMPGSFREIISKEDKIVEISSKAHEIAEKDKNFVRSDIGQVIGIMPDLEVYYGPTIGRLKLRSLIAEFWQRYYDLPELTYENVAITTGATEALGILITMLAYRDKVLLMVPHWPTCLLYTSPSPRDRG